MADDSISRQQEILIAARKEFTKEGISGARTQAIADNIGVTKAMIHYYFKTKENLFKEVFREASETLMGGLMDSLKSDLSLFQKIEQLIDGAIQRFNEYPELAGFVVSELNNHPELTQPIFEESFNYESANFRNQIEKAASNYEIAPVDPEQVITNIIALCMFPYSAHGFMKVLVKKDTGEYSDFLAQRRELIKDTVINWLAG